MAREERRRVTGGAPERPPGAGVEAAAEVEAGADEADVDTAIAVGEAGGDAVKGSDE